MRVCIHNCGNAINPRSKLNECVTCRHALYYWRSKSPAQIITRRRKLEVYGSRLDEHFDTTGKTLKELPKKKRRNNVLQFRRKQRA